MKKSGGRTFQIHYYEETCYWQPKEFITVHLRMYCEIRQGTYFRVGSENLELNLSLWKGFSSTPFNNPDRTEILQNDLFTLLLPTKQWHCSSGGLFLHDTFMYVAALFLKTLFATKITMMNIFRCVEQLLLARHKGKISFCSMHCLICRCCCF